MSTQRVTIIELSVYENTVPLVAGYLQCYAAQDPVVAERFDFDIYTKSLRDDEEAILDELSARDSAVYAFSCYIWNMGIVRRLLDELLVRRPNAHYVLGGPQVINHIEDYIRPHTTRALVCNGEGEQSFYEFLRQLASDEPDFNEVSGVSFWSADGRVVTTANAPRMRVLDEIPSPFSAGIFDGHEYTFTVLETNRGCPFHCGFCFWGAATNSKVYKFADERVRADIDWIAENGVASVFIADANWGLSPRDVELSRHLVNAKERCGFPTSMVIAAAKNRPDRVAEITEILVRGGLVTSQPISLQTVNGDALRLIERDNIRETTYTELQKTLNDKGISSFIELIWPLPGETLESFREGVARLCRLGADTLTIYPQLLLHNTSLYDQREELGIEVVRAPDSAAEADVVVATRWVSPADCIEGTWFYYAVHSLYNARAGYHLARYLDRRGVIRYAEFFTEAARFFQNHGGEICRFFARSVSTSDNYDLLNVGKAAHMVLHSHRGEFDHLLVDFCSSQPWWEDRAARLMLDVDLVARPYIYREPVEPPTVPLSIARLGRVTNTAVEIGVDGQWMDLIVDCGLLDSPGDSGLIRFEHPQNGKMPHPRLRDIEHNAAYCHVMIQRLRSLLPTCTSAESGAPSREPSVTRRLADVGTAEYGA